MPVPCYRFDDAEARERCTSYRRTNSEKANVVVYNGPYDLKYYLDRQPEESNNAKARNDHLNRGRVLVFTVIR